MMAGRTDHGVARWPQLRLAVNALLTVTLAPRCAACEGTLDDPLAGPVCARCWSNVQPLSPPVCALCSEPLPSVRAASAEPRCRRCVDADGAVDRGASYGCHDGPLRVIIHAFKYDGRRSLAPALATLMREAPGGVLTGADCIVPVPLHPWRRLRRGFNQAADLARHLGPPVVHALWRTRRTTPQAGLTAAARERNVARAFRISPLLTQRTSARAIHGRIVVIVDDVRTTGATLNECAEVLKHAGAREVRTLTIAVRTRT